MLKFLYETKTGRLLLKPLIHPAVSVASGYVMDSPISKLMIPSFIKKNHINMKEYQKTEYKSFNDFFCRRIKKERRPVNQSPDTLISPCDGLLSAYKIKKGLVLAVKQSKYYVDDLLFDRELAAKYEDGVCLVFRLCVNHYHRYCYPANGQLLQSCHIHGKYHTVRPIALRNGPVFIANTREYTIMDSDQFGQIIQMEVGAMLVGRIVNDQTELKVVKGMEKGHFEYGGSTVILLLEKNQVRIPERVFEMTKRSKEIPVKMGQVIGRKSQ